MFREFLLYSLKGFTSANFKDLVSAGRLDVVYQCILMSIYKSRSHRHDSVFHAILSGPPNPPLHISVSGDELKDARLDERSWENIIREVLSGGEHVGIKLEKKSFQQLIKEKSDLGYKIFILDMEGEKFDSKKLGQNNLFILGDQIGLPKKDMNFALRFGDKISIGKEEYLAASVIDILNYLIDSNN